MNLLRNSSFYGKLVCVWLLLYHQPALTQIIPDGSLPENSKIIEEGNTSLIEQGSKAGNNLFHSFEQFSVFAGRSAYFNNSLDIQNIIARITGSKPSNIDGIIKANGVANLFLINPSGIIFGANARLNLGGSFIASTANSILFADGTQFNTKISRTPSLLTISIPIGLSFESNPAPISIQQSVLNLANRKTLGLVSGGIDLKNSQLTAREGRIELGSVAEASLVNLDSAKEGFTFNYKSSPNFQNINLQRSIVDTSGNGNGGIQIQGKKLTLTDSSRILARTFRENAGGDLIVNTSDSIELVTGFTDNPRELTGLFTSTLGSGSAGNIRINTKQLSIRDGAIISVTSRGEGSGGNLIINASDLVSLSGVAQPTSQASALLSAATASGAAGNIVMNVERLIVKDGAAIAATTSSAGNGGSVTINAPQSIEVIGVSSTGLNQSSIRAGARETFSPDTFAIIKPTGNAGNLLVNTEYLSIKDRAFLSVENAGPGNAGFLRIQSSDISLFGGGINASAVSGEGGDVSLSSRFLQLNKSSITTSAGSSGNGGNININSDTIALFGSTIAANAERGRGGNIDITTQGLFTTLDSRISASSTLGFDGLVRISIPELDLTKAAQPEQRLQNPQVAVVCQGQAGVASSELIDAGTGGTPVSPSDSLDSSSGWRDLNSYSQEGINRVTQLASTKPTPLVEAQGWKRNDNGTVNFTTETDDIVPYGSLSSPSCIRTQSR